jgi:hypothetical protein
MQLYCTIIVRFFCYRNGWTAVPHSHSLFARPELFKSWRRRRDQRYHRAAAAQQVQRHWHRVFAETFELQIAGQNEGQSQGIKVKVNNLCAHCLEHDTMDSAAAASSTSRKTVRGRRVSVDKGMLHAARQNGEQGRIEANIAERQVCLHGRAPDTLASMCQCTQCSGTSRPPARLPPIFSVVTRPEMSL